MPDRAAKLISSFKDLDTRFRHPPFAKAAPSARSAYREAQRELFVLAQAITAILRPDIQAPLDAARRQAMEDIRTRIPIGFATMKAPKQNHVFRWSDYDITPEVSLDASIIGCVISRDTVKTILRLRRDQVRFISQLTR